MSWAVPRLAPPRLAIALLAALIPACAATPPAPPPPGAGAQPAARPAPTTTPPAPEARGAYGPEAAVSLSPLEAQAAEAARGSLGAGGARPQLSGSLSAAARLLARRAAQGADDPLGRTAVRDALAQACAYDPAPAAFLARAGPARLREVLSQAVTDVPASNFGVGVAEAGGSAVAVVLGSQRRARLDPFPREVKPGAAAVLSGELRGLHAPRVFVTLPSGQVQERDATGGAAFRAPISFGERGRYVVEVVGEGADGPTVAALMAISVGGASIRAPAEASAEDPVDPGQAEARVAAELSALRARHGLGPVVSSPELAAVARRHSVAMRAAGKVAHLLPGSPGPAERLTRAGIPYLKVFENVASAGSAIAAHRAAAESPAHLKNMLEPDVTRLGVGIEREVLPSGDPRVYLTEILVEPADAGDSSRLTPDGRVREALWRERARLELPPLTADPALDELARQGADELRRRDARELPDLAPRALALHRGLAAADGFVASAPGDATRSQNLRNPRFRRVGVGVIEGSSRRFGAGRLFIAVVYTD